MSKICLESSSYSPSPSRSPSLNGDFNESVGSFSSVLKSSPQLQGTSRLDKYKSLPEHIVASCPCDGNDHYEMSLLNEVVDLPVQFLFMALFYNAGISSVRNHSSGSEDDEKSISTTTPKKDDPLILEFRKNLITSRGIIGEIQFCDSISDDSFSLFDNLKDTSYNIPNNSEDRPYPTLNLKYTIPIANNLGMSIWLCNVNY